MAEVHDTPHRDGTEGDGERRMWPAAAVQARRLSILPDVLEHALDFLANGSGAEDHHVGMRLRGPHVTLRHGSDGGAKLFDHRLRGTAALAHIALLAALQTNVVGHVNENSGAQKVAQLRPVQGEQTFDDHKWRGLKRLRLAGASVDGKIVRRNFDGVSLAQVVPPGQSATRARELRDRRSWSGHALPAADARGRGNSDRAPAPAPAGVRKGGGQDSSSPLPTARQCQ